MFNLIKQNKWYFKLIGFILLIGFISGIIYYFFLNKDIKINIIESIANYDNFHYNSIIKDLIITSLILVTSIFIIGIPLSLFYLFYEFFSLGFMLSVFFVCFKISGIFYFLLFVIFNKLLVMLLMILFIKKTLNISRFILGNIVYKRNSAVKKNLLINLNNSIYLIVFILICNIIIYFVNPYVLNYFSFLLK